MWFLIWGPPIVPSDSATRELHRTVFRMFGIENLSWLDSDHMCFITSGTWIGSWTVCKAKYKNIGVSLGCASNISLTWLEYKSYKKRKSIINHCVFKDHTIFSNHWVCCSILWCKWFIISMEIIIMRLWRSTRFGKIIL